MYKDSCHKKILASSIILRIIYLNAYLQVCSTLLSRCACCLSSRPPIERAAEENNMSPATFKKNMPVSIILQSCCCLPAGLFEIARQMCLLPQQQTTLGCAAEDNNMLGAICNEHHTQHTDASVKLFSSSVSISV